MSAKVRFLGVLKEYQPDSNEDGAWQVEAGRSVQEIVDQTGVDSAKWEFVITVNGESVLRRYKLQDGDELVFTSLFAGGC